MSPPTLLTLPRELRQHILHYALKDATKKDLTLNHLLRKLASRFVDSYPLPQHCRTKFDGLLCYASYDEEEGILVDYAPHIYAAALTLHSGLPELGEDVVFVIGKALTGFEGENERARGRGLDEQWRRYWVRYPHLAAFFAAKFPRGQRMKPSI